MAQAAANEALASLRSGMSMEELDAQLHGRTPAADGETGENGEGPDAALEPEDEEEEDPLAPRVEETGDFGRADTPISGPFDNGPLVREAFELSMESPLPEEPVQLGSDWFVFRVKARSQPSEDDFTEEVQSRIRDGLTRAKEREALQIYVHRLRSDAETEGAIRINEGILRYGTDDEEEGQDDEEESADEDDDEEESP